MRYSPILFLLFIACTQSKVQQEKPETQEDLCSKVNTHDTIALSKTLAPFDTLISTKTAVYVLEDGGVHLSQGHGYVSMQKRQ